MARIVEGGGRSEGKTKECGRKGGGEMGGREGGESHCLVATCMGKVSEGNERLLLGGSKDLK